MSERDGKLMHLTAESTNTDLSSLVAQAATDCLTGKLKRARRTLPRPDRGWTKRERVREMSRSGDGHCHPVLSTSF